MIIPQGIGLWIILGASALLCFIGFFRFVWFLSVGYGLSSAGIGIAMLVLSLVSGEISVPFIILSVLFIVYGVRLGGFLLIRELKNKNYRAKLKEVGGETKVPIFVSFFMWILLSILYVSQSAGPVYRLLNGATNTHLVSLYIGIALSALGIVLEAVADKQKSQAKDINPNMPAMHGLYKMCRCPNYFGEILFWTGSIVSGIGAVEGWQWLVVGLGYVCIVFIMISGAKRVETRHIKHYGKIEEYIAYANKTPILFPLLPIYHFTSEEKIAKEQAKKEEKNKKKAQ